MLKRTVSAENKVNYAANDLKMFQVLTLVRNAGFGQSLTQTEP